MPATRSRPPPRLGERAARERLAENAQKKMVAIVNIQKAKLSSPEQKRLGQKLMKELAQQDEPYFRHLISLYSDLPNGAISDRNYMILGVQLSREKVLLARQVQTRGLEAIHGGFGRSRKPSSSLRLTGVGRTEEWVAKHAAGAQKLNERFQSDPAFARRFSKQMENANKILYSLKQRKKRLSTEPE